MEKWFRVSEHAAAWEDEYVLAVDEEDARRKAGAPHAYCDSCGGCEVWNVYELEEDEVPPDGAVIVGAETEEAAKLRESIAP